MTDATLRPLRADDWEGVLAGVTASGDMDRQGDVRDEPTATAYVQRLLDPSGSHLPWAIARPDDSLTGIVAVSVDRANRLGWFWYWLNVADRGHGWARRGAIAVANWALGEGGLHRLELGHRANNPASGEVALAAGFIREGCERQKFWMEGGWVDVLTYGRLDTDPAPTASGLSMVGSFPA